jgi:hypothetical protein
MAGKKEGLFRLTNDLSVMIAEKTRHPVLGRMEKGDYGWVQRGDFLIILERTPEWITAVYTLNCPELELPMDGAVSDGAKVLISTRVFENSAIPEAR